jgi:protein-disulfide isomerase
MGNRFVLVLAACAVLFFGLLVFNKKDAPSTNTSISATSHTQGNGPVTLVEYGDFECPGCGRFHPVLKQVKEKYGDKITFQFRNFPLTQIHQNAMIAHRAAEAADKQGKFWEMHDFLYENQSSWVAQAGATQSSASSIIEAFARQLNLNMDQFNSDRASSTVNDAIQADIRAGQDLRVDSTPTFFLDGTKLENARDTLEYFSEKIDAALAAKNPQ